MLIVNKTIKGIITVLVIVVVLGGSSYLYANIAFPLTKSSFELQTKEVQNLIMSSADIYISNLNNCINKQKANCICRNMITSFSQEIDIKMINRKDTMDVEFLFDDNSFRKNSVNGLVSGVYTDGKKIEELPVKGEKAYENKVDFKKFTFRGEKIISKDLYKPDFSKIAFITYESKGINPWAPNEEKQKAFFDKLPEC